MAESYEEADDNIEFINQCLEAERNLLAIFLDFPDSFLDYKDRVKPDLFIDERHAIIFGILLELSSIGADFSYPTLISKIKELNLDSKVDQDFLTVLYNDPPTSLSTNYFLKQVIAFAQRRQLSDIGVNLYNDVRERNPNIGQIVAETQEQLNSVVNSDAELKLSDLTAPAILTDTVHELRNTDKGTAGVQTGFSQLDSVTNGLKPGELIIIAGRPASGKSTFAMNICEYAGYINRKNFNKPIAVFTLEMPSTQVMMRSLARIGTINQNVFQGKNFTPDFWSKLYASVDIIKEANNFYIDDSSYGLTVEKVRSRVRQIAQANRDENGNPQMGIVLIDYLQLLEAEQNFRDRHLLIAHIAKSLKALAREFACPVLALSQLNRNVDTRGPDSRPTNADLRESGAIEQDADIVIMVHRPETNAPPEKKEELKGKAEIIITKNRQGEIGTVYLRFEGQYSRFVDDKSSSFKLG